LRVRDPAWQEGGTTSYDRFAPYFDAWQRAFGGSYDALILPRVRAALARHAPGARRIADLGVGTGDLAVALARAGCAVVAVDRSAPMLQVARAKAAGLDAPPVFVEQDLRTLRLEPPVDAAVCVYTVMNQLTGDGDLERALDAVHGALVPGGVFVFELNLPAAYARYWSGRETVDIPGAVVVREHHADRDVIEARIMIRSSDGEDLHDAIAQRAYGDVEVERALAGAGFLLLERAAFNPFDARGEPVKALWAARASEARQL
jgi:SAM-dependent methyltransferase